MEAANVAIVKAISNDNNNIVAADVKQLKIVKSNKKKVNVLKAALLTLFGKSRQTTKCNIQGEVIADANNWAMLVGCVHTDSTNIMLMSDDTKNNNEEKVLEKNQSVVVDQEDEEKEKSECGGDSRYASALNLQELDKSTNGSSSDEDDSEEEVFDDTQGDAMIDMKAEMFIAQFYAQMKMDNSEHHTSRTSKSI